MQNADTLTHREAWNDASVHTREALSLAAFTLICRRFKNCDLPYSAHELSELIRAPGHILNESLNSLSDLGLINSISETEDDGDILLRYQPARPLDSISLGDFKNAFEGYGNNEGAELIHEVDPLIDLYRNELRRFTQSELGSRTFEQLLSSDSNS